MNAPFSHMTPDAPQVVVFTPAMRTLIADAIESLILLLDEIDGDVELEDCDPAEECGDAEPSLGATHGRTRAGRGRRRAPRLSTASRSTTGARRTRALSRGLCPCLRRGEPPASGKVLMCGRRFAPAAHFVWNVFAT
jgi:hypothetical protein